jgi:hypothetical protein
MGTNYYAKVTPCPTCHDAERLHIGKQSVGWRFIFRGYEEPGKPTDIETWRAFLAREDVTIYDGDTIVDKVKFWDMVARKADQKRDEYAQRGSVADVLFREFS